MLERTSPNLPEPNETPITLSGLHLINCEDHIKAFSQADFLIRTLKSPEISDYFKKTPPKGIRTNLFYVTDRSQTSMADILADDKGAYLKSRSDKKLYYCTDGKVNIVYEENNKYYYNARQSSKSYSKIYVEPDNVIALKRIYGKAKSFPLSRTVTTISSPANGPESPAVAVLYQTTENIAEDAKCLPHGSMKKANAKSYFRTSKDVLKNTKQKLNSGLNPEKVYDKINGESGGVYNSVSQSHELRDIKQVYRQNQNLKNTAKASQPSSNASDELTSAILMQRNDPDFIRTVSYLRNSYYIFLGTNVQLENIAQFCCEKENVLCIDKTFNLCENWVSDSCYNNIRIETSEGKNPIFMGPAMIHFNKEEFTFTCTYNPGIKELKVISTDLEKAIFNGFASQIAGLKVLLCVLHLQKNDKTKPSELSSKGSTPIINRILADIYGRRYGTIKELGLADSKDLMELSERLEKLKKVGRNYVQVFTFGLFEIEFLYLRRV